MKFKKYSKYIIASTLTLSLVFFVTSAYAQTPLHDSVLGNVGRAAGGLSGDDPREITIRIINWSLGLIGTIFLVFTIYAGFLWMTARGNKDQVEKAQGMLRDGVIGVVIIFLGFAIANMVFALLNKA